MPLKTTINLPWFNEHGALSKIREYFARHILVSYSLIFCAHIFCRRVYWDRISCSSRCDKRQENLWNTEFTFFRDRFFEVGPSTESRSLDPGDIVSLYRRKNMLQVVHQRSMNRITDALFKFIHKLHLMDTSYQGLTNLL
jgi:hypothetical protein